MLIDFRFRSLLLPCASSRGAAPSTIRADLVTTSSRLSPDTIVSCEKRSFFFTLPVYPETQQDSIETNTTPAVGLDPRRSGAFGLRAFLGGYSRLRYALGLRSSPTGVSEGSDNRCAGRFS